MRLTQPADRPVAAVCEAIRAAARDGRFEYTDTDGISRSIPRYIFYPKEN